MPHFSPLGDPIGAPVEGWTPPPRPDGAPLEGRLVRLEPLGPAHAEALYAAMRTDREARNWTYLPYGPFASLTDYLGWVDGVAGKPDPFFLAVIDRATGEATGVASYLRIDPGAGSIEVGHINFSPLLQRSPGSTEAMYLMMRWAFEAGYRRYEWKCNALNAPSRRAALRLGLSFEGVFRQHMIAKGRNRDTAWYAAIDREWPALRAAFEAWLDPANFDAEGSQRQRLSDLTRPLLAAIG